MKAIAVNASKALYDAMDEFGTTVDYIKVPLSPYPGNRVAIKEAQLRAPLLLHVVQRGVLDLPCWNDESAISETALSELLEMTNTPFLSTHISTYCECLPTMSASWTNTELRNRVKDRIITNSLRLMEILEKTKRSIPLLLENHALSPWSGILPFTCSPSFLNEVAEAAGTGLLLDIAHARASAWLQGIETEQLLAQYNLAAVKEIHVSGARYHQPYGMLDEHNNLDDSDYKILTWLLSETDVSVISLEYGGMGDEMELPDGTKCTVSRNNPFIVAEQVAKIRELCGREK